MEYLCVPAGVGKFFLFSCFCESGDIVFCLGGSVEFSAGVVVSQASLNTYRVQLRLIIGRSQAKFLLSFTYDERSLVGSASRFEN